MRPLELTIEGFNSYREASTFSFDGRTLFGIVGPTGSGKSSILDAMLYALYGKTPRIERSTKMLVNSASDMARVVLLFETNSGVWEVTRILRKKGQSQVILKKSDDSAPVVSGESNVNVAIEDLIGLDFRAFLSTVSLPQGEFDKFLHSAASDRSRILKGIFRLDRVDKIREVAKRLQAEVDGKMSALSQQSASLPDDPEAQIDALLEDLRDAEALQEEVKVALPAILKLEAEAERSDEELARLSSRVDEVTSLVVEIPSPDSLQEQADIAATATDEFSAAEQALAVATEALVAAVDARAKADASTGGDAWIQQMTAAVAEGQRLSDALAKAEADAKQAIADHAAAEVARASAADQLEKSSAGVIDAQTALEALHRAHAADLLRKELKAGDPCPVCEQKVAGVPKIVKVAGVDKAEQALAKAKQHESKVREALTKADVALGVARDRMEGLTLKVVETKSSLKEVDALLGELVPEGADPGEELTRRKSLIATSTAGETKARAMRDEAEQRERAARKTVEVATKGLDGSVRSLIKVCGALRVPFAGTEPYPQLPGIAKQAHESALGELDSLREKAAAIDEVKQRSSSAIDEFRRRFEATPEESASDVVARFSQRVLTIQHAIASLKEAIARRAQMQEQIAVLASEKALIERVTTDFTDSRFTKFLLDGQRRLLSRLGSEKLIELTGHYRFDEDGEFNIIDTRSGSTRHSDTLSGGETFLASLALALALAEAVALEGGQLGCFFLDEGFGSLDAESLDLALEGIESLATPGRVIGLISHVFSIQSRLDDLIVLEKDAEGSTVVVQDGGPIGYMAPMI